MAMKRVIRLPEQQYITEYLRRATDLEYDRYSMEKILEKLKGAKVTIEDPLGKIRTLEAVDL